MESVSGRPDELARAVDLVLDFTGPEFTVERFESAGAPGALAYRGAQRPAFAVILNAHVDVVPAPAAQFGRTVRVRRADRRAGHLRAGTARRRPVPAIQHGEVCCPASGSRAARKAAHHGTAPPHPDRRGACPTRRMHGSLTGFASQHRLGARSWLSGTVAAGCGTCASPSHGKPGRTSASAAPPGSTRCSPGGALSTEWLREGSSVAQKQTIRDFGKSRATALKDRRDEAPGSPARRDAAVQEGRQRFTLREGRPRSPGASRCGRCGRARCRPRPVLSGCTRTR